MNKIHTPKTTHNITNIKNKNRLPVRTCRQEPKAAPVFPHLAMEGGDGVATRKPLPQWRHGKGRILAEKLDEAVKIHAFPGLHITADEAFLCFIRPRRN